MAHLPATLQVDISETPEVGATSPSSTGVAQFQLRHVSDPAKRSFSFTPSVDAFIGRDAESCTLSFPDAPVLSRQHCRLFSMGRDAFVHDLSSNGTFINGRLVGRDSKKALRHGDLLSLVNPKLVDQVQNFTWVFESPFEDAAANAAVAAAAASTSLAAPPGATGVHAVYHLGKILGTGNFAAVRLGTNRSSGRQVAVKIVEKKRWALSGTDFSFSSLFTEVDVLRRMQHRNIIGIVDVFDNPDAFTMVLELVSGGDLFDYIVGRGFNPFTEDDAKRLFVQLIEALLYMHSRDVVHRDLKPENILVAVEPAFYEELQARESRLNGGQPVAAQQLAKSIPVDKVTLKLTDFGLAKFCKEHDVMTTMCGTPAYLAPEVIADRFAAASGVPGAAAAAARRGYSWSVDVWSMGVILFVLLSGTTPKTPEKGVTYNQYFASISADAKNLIEWMLKPNPEERAHLSDIVAHPWLRGVEIVGKELARRRSREECEALQLSRTTVAPVQPSLTASGPSMLSAVAFLQQAAAGQAAGHSSGSPSRGISKDGGSSHHTGPSTPLLPPGYGAPVLGTVPTSTPPTPSPSGSASAAATVAGIAEATTMEAPPAAALVRWYWQSDLDVADEALAQAWTGYSAADSEAIERMYRRKTVRSCKIPSTDEYRVSFEGMFQYRVSDTARQRPVRRWEGTPDEARLLTAPGARITFSKV